MDYTNFDSQQFEQQMEALKTNKQRIEDLKAANIKIASDVISLIREVTLDWEPKYNEKAISINPGEMTACHVWFIEEQCGDLRFKEAPGHYPDNHHYVRVDKTSPTNVLWVVPLKFFMALNEGGYFYLYQNTYSEWGLPPTRKFQ